MPRPGPKRKVSDARLLLELYIAGEYTFASEIEEDVDLDTVQGVRDRLNKLVEETDHVEVKKVSGRNLYRLTDAGEEYVVEELRQQLD